MKSGKADKQIKIRAGSGKLQGLIRLGLTVFLTAALSNAAFSKNTETMTADGITVMQAAGDNLPAHRHRARTVILVVEQDSNGEVRAWWRDPRQPGLGIAGNVLKDKLTEKGYEIIDHAAAANFLNADAATAVSELTTGQAKIIGKQVNAEVAIIGKAALKIVGDHKNLKLAQADIAVKAVWVETGQLIALSLAHASATHNEERTAGSEALKQAAAQAADRLLEKMSHFCMEPHGYSRPVTITITGLDERQFLKFKDVLRSQVRGVKDIHERSFTGTTAKISVDSSISAQALCDNLSLKDFGDFTVEEVNSAANTLELKAVLKQ